MDCHVTVDCHVTMDLKLAQQIMIYCIMILNFEAKRLQNFLDKFKEKIICKRKKRILDQWFENRIRI